MSICPVSTVTEELIEALPETLKLLLVNATEAEIRTTLAWDQHLRALSDSDLHTKTAAARDFLYWIDPFLHRGGLSQLTFHDLFYLKCSVLIPYGFSIPPLFF